MIEKNKYVDVVSHSLKGTKRDKNQDDVLFIEDSCYFLFFLFDGVSSLKGSITLINVLKNFIRKNYEAYFSPTVELATLLYDANKYISKKQVDGLTTCSAVYLSKEKLNGFFCNIGDSRIYSFSRSYIEQITVDDSLIKNSNILTKALGSHTLEIEDFNQAYISLGEGLLLCSDGFYSLMESNLKRYFDVLQFKRLKNIVKALKHAQSFNNSDDSTYLIIRPNEIYDRT